MAPLPGEVFDSPAEYAQRIAGLVPGYEQLHEALLFSARTLRPEAQSILEIGVGTGGLTEKVLDAYPDAYVVGMDYSEKMMGYVKRRVVTERLRLVPGDMRQLPAVLGFDGEPESYNLVVSGFAIHHLSDGEKRQLYQAVHGLLDAQGVFLNVDRIAPHGEREELLSESHFSHHMLQGGYTQEEVLERRFSREENDRPSTVDEQQTGLTAAGFEEAFLAWRAFGNGLVVATKAPPPDAE